jgi:hypothetical protein
MLKNDNKQKIRAYSSKKNSFIGNQLIQEINITKLSKPINK